MHKTRSLPADLLLFQVRQLEILFADSLLQMYRDLGLIHWQICGWNSVVVEVATVLLFDCALWNIVQSSPRHQCTRAPNIRYGG
jgi:hypothetical protein